MDWREMATCRGADPELFFPIGHSNSSAILMQVDEAKAVCRRCPVMEQCLDWAVKAGPVEGVWGGTTEKERRAISQSRLRQLRSRMRTAS
ncbi:WhiB family transcriptional regulator [Streptomyces sp. NBC_01619]|uniref:WhiB family transcriptional regulator n=1 Tax=unclassified Streptomyces TaxID=2593676 RepID=UPI002256EE75|nr:MULTISPECIES: WhiB family transcriptional regulator [unclassified Streptomyces]MCX4513865.1 WhiB family transcriptional regulator [Streptomyces sp. NBC_01619]